ncbi:cytochrome P450 [Dactylosporangium sp. NPDC000244]|uniref:cytochrome P450 n=1 Tax=Dactylosporangium sp. NPDC000244 TaxID=3154365 RepID=UPI003331715E
MPIAAPDQRLEYSLACLHDPGTIADPSAFYDRLLTAGTVFDPVTGGWLVARHADVQLLLAHPAASARMDHAGSLARFPGAGLEAAFTALDLHVSFTDGAGHRRLRRVLAEPVQVRHVRTTLAEPVTAAVTAALDDLTGRPDADMVAGFAARIPIDVTRSLLAIPAAISTETIRRWSLAWGDVVAAPGHVPTTGRAAILRTVAELAGFLRDHIAGRERSPGTAMIDALIAAMHAGTISRDALLANLMLLVTAGSETTTNLLSAAVMALADEPWLWALLRHNPDRIPDAVAELGRRYPPTQYTARRLLEPVTLASGQVLPAGAAVVLMLAAANRDPAVFPDPDRIRLDRPGRAVTFGHGPHACFGAPLARLEVATAIRLLTTRCTRLDPLPGRPWRRNANLRGLAHLPVALHTTAGAR